MENGKRFEQYYGAKLNALEIKNLEKFGEDLREKLKTEMDDEFGRHFEAPKQFDNEDEKNRYVELQNEVSDVRNQINEISSQISAATQQLAALPLTTAQQQLLTIIDELIARRAHASTAMERAEIDMQIDKTTKDLTDLPMTNEQGALLDDILQLIDEREKTELKLQNIFRRASS